MAFIPSSKMYNNLLNEHEGVFFEKTLDGGVPFVVKLPSSMIKHIYNKCTIKLIISIDSRIKRKLITVGFIVEDEPDNPFCTFYTINNKSDLNAFTLAIKRRYNKLHLFDELSRNVLSGELIISKDVNDLIKFLDENLINIDIGLDEKHKNEDLFENNFISLYNGGTPESDYWFDIDLDFLANSPNKIFDLDAGRMQINQLDEGAGMEQSIYQMINSYYAEESYHSPFYYKRNIKKELTDILVLSQQYSILIESKTIKVMHRDKQLTVDRMIRNINKSITEAFGQLKGALRTIRSRTDVFTANNNIIIQQKNRDNVHSVVLIPEMHPHLNWKSYYKEIRIFEEKYNSYLHIMDLSELFRITFVSRDPETLEENLLLRWQTVLEAKSAYVMGAV